jgi:hypothetical protein
MIKLMPSLAEPLGTRITVLQPIGNIFMTTLDLALETVMQLSLDQQELLIEILRQRHLEASQDEIAKDAQESIAAFKAGKLKLHNDDSDE